MKKFWQHIRRNILGIKISDPQDLFTEAYPNSLPEYLTITYRMLWSDDLPYEAGDLVAALYYKKGDSKQAFAQKLRELPPLWGTLKALMYYNSMVNNGGHHQYFWNSEGADIDLVEAGLKLYGAEAHLDIFQAALKRYDPEQYRRQYEQAKVDWQAAFLTGKDLYEDLDSAYFRSDPKLPTVIEDFIRENVDLFKNNRTGPTACHPKRHAGRTQESMTLQHLNSDQRYHFWMCLVAAGIGIYAGFCLDGIFRAVVFGLVVAEAACAISIYYGWRSALWFYAAGCVLLTCMGMLLWASHGYSHRRLAILACGILSIAGFYDLRKAMRENPAAKP